MYDGHLANLDMALAERMKRFRAFAEKLPASLALGVDKGTIPPDSSLAIQKQEVVTHLDAFQESMRELVKNRVQPHDTNHFLDAFEGDVSAGYLTTLKSLNESHRCHGRDWLFGLVHEVEEVAARAFPLTYV